MITKSAFCLCLQIILIKVLLSPFLIKAQQNDCSRQVQAPRVEFVARIDFPQVDVKWHQEWLDMHNGQKVYPEPITRLEKWNHPKFNTHLPYSMHEDSKASDVSNFPGPIPDGISVKYFHVLEKGAEFSGMAPAFNFVTEDTLVTLSFGRSHTHLLLVYLGDTMKLLDCVEVPGREHSAISLISKKKRMEIFRNTMGGAYSYLSNNRNMYIPGVNNDIIRIPVGNGQFNLDNVGYINVTEQIYWGNIVDKKMNSHQRENHLTAILPDKDGNIWFTSQQGIIGMIHNTEVTDNGCPKVYANMITQFGLIEKLNYFKDTKYKDWDDLPDFITEEKHMTPEMRDEFVKYYKIDRSNFEVVQNSFAVGQDGIYIVSSLAFYKLRFNEDKKSIELDPEWERNFVGHGLIYDNDLTIKPGHLNVGSGTSPTLMDNRFVAIVDNDTSMVNLCIFSQKSGNLINRFPLFSKDSSACENSIIAYKNTFIVANTFGYVDPFGENITPGGMMRFDYDESKGEFVRHAYWPAYEEPLDAQTATPKLSNASGMVYFYDTDAGGGPTPYDDWRISTLDFRTGTRVFSIKPYFEEGDFNDNIKGLKIALSLGKDQYDRKVFNNIWGTFCFGPKSSLFIGTYRGFVRFKSTVK